MRDRGSSRLLTELVQVMVEPDVDVPERGADRLSVMRGEGFAHCEAAGVGAVTGTVSEGRSLSQHAAVPKKPLTLVLGV